ncbi:CBS domain-containing protein [Aggregicoccus sp. 17bor-14]|uniref:CBS domain-containing protein n=1 Tax=Myxococcaceae TaxID=31 RepID=UPI00129CEEEE|nr:MULTISPECIES: CBS domain-containing protein [Myxococcaceae]MBF5044974.1 CBS domain-containing protein [Simulacricoccus sp. 17bor-14]MRI90717.1 CBS domain-containing protein [Aggregicoccus sp. 17bor-14]
MKVREVMTREVIGIGPERTLREAAELMKALNVGPLPVVEHGRLRGMVTDRDLVVRGIAEGLDPQVAQVGQVMSEGAFTCGLEEDVVQAAEQMRELQVRRLLVVDERGHLVGIVALGDLALDVEDETLAGRTLEAISEPTPNVQ